jgi:hypothetical protein
MGIFRLIFLVNCVLTEASLREANGDRCGTKSTSSKVNPSLIDGILLFIINDEPRVIVSYNQ